jgi:predicted Zn-dependent protease
VASVVETIQGAYNLAGRGQADAALEELRRYLRMHHDQPDVHHHLGLMLLQMGQPDQALSPRALDRDAPFQRRVPLQLRDRAQHERALSARRWIRTGGR